MKTTAKDVRDRYDTYASIYDKLFGLVLEPGRKALARELRHHPLENILEIGVGTGLLLPQYPPQVPVTGVDLSPGMLKKAREKVDPHRPAPVTLLVADGEVLPFEDNAFSCITLPYTYSVTPDPQAFMREVRRVCTPEGLIVILNHFSNAGPVWRVLESLAKPFTRKVGFDSDFSYQDHVEAYDWKIESVEKVNAMQLSRLIVIRNSKPA